MMKHTAALLLTQAIGALAVGNVNYTEPKSSISFTGYSDDKGLMVGMALPESPSTDFIANIVGPMTDGEGGWAGLDMGVTMANKLLLVAWPNGDDVVLSARKATGYANPAVYDEGDITLKPIAEGTYVNSTHYSATFLCAGCITGDSLTFEPDVASGIFAYAYSNDAVDDPSDSAATLTYHAAGFSGFGLPMGPAKSSKFATWAAMASEPTDNPTTEPPSNDTPINGTIPVSNTTYDYIVAGGGPAGLVAASRLAETGASVLLVERGGPSFFSTGSQDTLSWNDSVTAFDVPGMAYSLTTSVPSDSYCTDTAAQAGCVLGGSGSVNALMYVKPQDADFDNDAWPAGWKSADVKAAAERFYGRNPGTDMPSRDGQRYDQDAFDVLSGFFGSPEGGFRMVDPLAAPNEKHDVYAHPVWNIQEHMRGGPLRTYLPRVQGKDNFRLALHTKVVRAVRDDGNGTWTSGIEIQNANGNHEIIRVTPGTGKVLLAAGALSTPRILFYSGIGPTAQIEAAPASVRLPAKDQWIDLPVGQGVKDHPILSIPLKVNGGLDSLNSSAFTDPDAETVELWKEGSGLLTQSGQRFNLWTSVKSPSDGKTRFLQVTANSPAPDQVVLKTYITHGLTSSTDLVLDASGANTQFDGDLYLQTRGDVEAYEMFLERLLTMTRRANSTLTLQLSDDSPVPANATAASLLASYRDAGSALNPGSHYVGTAAMGAVTDADTRVLGTDNLFVVDASMHPDLPTGNTQVIVMVAAERAVERILGEAPPANGTMGGGDGAGNDDKIPFRPFGKGNKKNGRRSMALRRPRAGPAVAVGGGLMERSPRVKDLLY